MAEKRPGKARAKNANKKTNKAPQPKLHLVKDQIQGSLFDLQEEQGANDQAQMLMYDAWETPDRKRRVKMAREALEIWPDCADAWGLLARDGARSPHEALEFYEKGMQAGERALGKEAFDDDVGYFWGILETRPYMRARAGLAQALEAAVRGTEAIEHYCDLLRLNPNDNQGIRYLLLRALIEADENDEAWKWISQYDDEASAAWMYPKALLAFRQTGAAKSADKLLLEAIEYNPFVPDYLLGTRKLPKRLPDLIGLGDRDEAVAYVAECRSIWERTPGALEWLRGVTKAAV